LNAAEHDRTTPPSTTATAPLFITRFHRMAMGQPPRSPALPAPSPASAALIARRLVEFGDDGSVIFKVKRGAPVEGHGGLLSIYFRAKSTAAFRRNITGKGYCNFFDRHMQSVRRVTEEEAAAARQHAAQRRQPPPTITTTPSDGALWLSLPGLQRDGTGAGAGLGMRIVPTAFRGCASRFTAAASEADLATFTRLAKDQTQAPPPKWVRPCRPPPPPPSPAAAVAMAMAPAVLMGMAVRQHPPAPPSVVPVPTPPPRQPLRLSPVLTPPLLPLRAPQRKRERDDDAADDDEAMLMPRYPRPRSLSLAVTAADADTLASAAAGATFSLAAGATFSLAAAADPEFRAALANMFDDDDLDRAYEADDDAAAAAAAAADLDLDADLRFW
jgi:hypothetical protein